MFVANFTRGALAVGAGVVLASCSAMNGASPGLPVTQGAPTSSAAAAAERLALQDGDGPVRTHMASMAFYEGENENNDLPASFMVANYDWTEQAADSAGAADATAFHAAGGLHAMAYMNPNAIKCSSDQPGSCNDLETELDNMGEDGYLHTSSGERAYSNGEQRLDTLTDTFTTAWNKQVNDFLTLTPAWTIAQGGSVEVDTENWVTLNGFTYHGGPFQEITEQTQVTQAQSGVPLGTPNYSVLNGVDYDYPNGGMYDQILDKIGKHILGEFNEDAFATSYGSGYMTESYPIAKAWSNQEDGILDLTGRGLHDYVWMEGDSSPAHRLYGLASVWLVKRGARVVVWEDFCAPDKTPKGYCNSTWPDAQVVPRHPLQTATGGSIETLGVGSLYRREFAACFQAGTSIGGCAAIVNPSGSSASMPTLQQHYAHSIVLPTSSLYGGGSVTWSTQVPTSIPASSAVILAS
jgi:hypothetical protein